MTLDEYGDETRYPWEIDRSGPPRTGSTAPDPNLNGTPEDTTPRVTPAGPTTTTPPPSGGMSEDEGRAYDLAHGLLGGYMGANGWVHGEPRSSGGGTSNPTAFGSGSPYQFQELSWPEWNPPSFQAPAPFSYADFVPPDLAEAQNEPGYKFAADEGAKRIQNNAAAKGNIISGMAVKDLVKWANDYATQNYNGVYGRKLQTYGTNRNNAAENYMTNYNVSRDVFDRNYNSYYQGDQSRRDKAKLNFQRDWDIYQSDIDTKKYLAGLGST